MDRVIFYKGAIYLSTDSALIPLVTNEFHLGTHEEFKKAFQDKNSFLPTKNEKKYQGIHPEM